jgi:hypothetical protein
VEIEDASLREKHAPTITTCVQSPTKGGKMQAARKTEESYGKQILQFFSISKMNILPHYIHPHHLPWPKLGTPQDKKDVFAR